MEDMFHTILGSIILLCILFYVSRVLLTLNNEGFFGGTAVTTISKDSPPPSSDYTTWCPKMSVLFLINTFKDNISSEKWVCYPVGITPVDSIFSMGLPNTSIKIYYPKGYTVQLFSSANGSGVATKTFDDSNSLGSPPGFNFQVFNSLDIPFASIKIVNTMVPTVTTSPTGVTQVYSGLSPVASAAYTVATSPTGVTQTCPGLSPVASAAALAAENVAAANAAKAADIAKITSKVVADNLAPQMTSPSGLNVICPSGETPIINNNSMRNTKFTAEKKRPQSMFDRTCGSNEYNFDPDKED